jgi:hypothetical protein
MKVYHTGPSKHGIGYRKRIWLVDNSQKIMKFRSHLMPELQRNPQRKMKSEDESNRSSCDVVLNLLTQ